MGNFEWIHTYLGIEKLFQTLGCHMATTSLNLLKLKTYLLSKYLVLTYLVLTYFVKVKLNFSP